MSGPCRGNKRKPGKVSGRVSVDDLVGRRLRLKREALGLDKRALAKAVGVTAKQIAAFEAGKARVGPALLDAIADELGVGVTWFFLEPGAFG